MLHADVSQTISIVMQLAHNQCLDTRFQQSTSLRPLRCTDLNYMCEVK